jgi:PAS domain S-box-containing protein
MMVALLLQGAAQPEISSAQRIIQFAAVLLEAGGAILIAVLFAIVARSSQRRGYFTTWTVSWTAMALAIGAVCARYFLLSATPSGAPPEGALSVRALYWLYEIGKFSYWVLIWRGAVEYATPVGAGMSRWRWKGIAVAAGTVCWLLSSDLNQLLVWQAPVAIACCLGAARALMRLGPVRRTVGSVVTATVLGITAVLWTVYFVAFGNVVKIFAIPIGALSEPILAYNTYADMLLLVVLGFAMLMVFMEDARRRITDIESRLASHVMEATDPILTIDSHQRVLLANHAAERVFGSGPRLVTGSDVTDLVEPADRDRVRAAIAAFAEGNEGLRQIGEDGGWLHGVREDGAHFTAEFSLSRLYDTDVTAVSLVVRDMTTRREQEERRRQASTMEAVRQLAGGLAHDFNNLLTTIVGRSQVVGRTLPAGSVVREDVAQIEQAAAAAARLSRGLLALSRREPLNPERIAVDDVVRAAESTIRGILGSGVTCSLSLYASNTFAHVDRARLHGALLALTQNAREAMGDTGTLTVETSIALLPQQFGSNIEAACISLRDTGSGLDPQARAHLFEPFFSTKGDGRGLGLATTWAFVHQSGGTIDIESTRQGTTVRLLFPIASRVAGDDATPSTPSLAIVPETARPSRTVLVAEDEASVRRSVRVFLERAGFTVVDAADGVDALAAFEKNPDEFGLLLTDVMMPQMGGRELATKVMERRPDMPIVFMSGFLRDPEVLRMVNDRRVRFLAKPFDIDLLVSTVSGELGGAEADVA